MSLIINSSNNMFLIATDLSYNLSYNLKRNNLLRKTIKDFFFITLTMEILTITFVFSVTIFYLLKVKRRKNTKK